MTDELAVVEQSLEKMAVKEDQSSVVSPVACSEPADTSGFCEVMYNRNYGEFSTSLCFDEEYNRRMLAINPLYKAKETGRLYFEPERDDPVAIQVLKDLGRKASSDKYASLYICRIPIRYKGFYRINEYDGFESVEIKYDAYRVARIKDITVNSSLSNDERLREIIGVLGESNLTWKGKEASNLAIGPLADTIPLLT